MCGGERIASVCAQLRLWRLAAARFGSVRPGGGVIIVWFSFGFQFTIFVAEDRFADAVRSFALPRSVCVLSVPPRETRERARHFCA